MSHRCHAFGCTKPCRPEYLMCPGHWRRVPLSLQRAVYATYRPGQCDDKDPSPEWHAAADRAIASVARSEGHTEAAKRYEVSADRWDNRAEMARIRPAPVGQDEEG